METAACWNQIGISGDASCSKLAEAIHCRNCPTYTKAALALLDRELPTGYLEEWAEHFSRAQTGAGKGDLAGFIFRIGDEWLAISASILEEVCGIRPIHSLPHRRSGVVLGVANVRGELLVCTSLAALLGITQSLPIPAAAGRQQQRLLVIGRGGDRFVFPADEVFGIQHYHSSDLQDAPATVGRALGTFTRSILPWRQRSVGLLESAALLEALNRNLA